MDTGREEFLDFIMTEKGRNIFAFAFYILYIVLSMGIELSEVVECICFICFVFLVFFVGIVYLFEWIANMFNRNRGKIRKNIATQAKRILKEILMFIPVFLISQFLITVIMNGKPANQIAFEQAFYEAPIMNSIVSIILAPIIEEFVCRFLPSRFLKNKYLYIIVSTVVFAAMHVINDSTPFYYIWFYMTVPLYYGCRYYKTKNLLVPISMHVLNNLIATAILVFA